MKIPSCLAVGAAIFALIPTHQDMSRHVRELFHHPTIFKVVQVTWAEV